MLRTELLLVSPDGAMGARADAMLLRPDAGTEVRASEVWASLRGGLRRFVASRAAAADVDDLVQEILLRATRASPRQGALTPPLVHGIARHVVQDHHRRRAREHARLARLAGEPDDPGGEPLSRVEGDVAAALSFFLWALPPHHQAAVRAVDVEGRAQADVARELGVPLSTLRTRVQRGRAELRALLRKACSIELDARGHVLSCEPRRERECGGGAAAEPGECGGCASQTA